MENRNTEREAPIPNELFAQLGGGDIAYVRPIQSDKIAELFPGAPALQPGVKLWALLNADGAPILVADSRSAAIAKTPPLPGTLAAAQISSGGWGLSAGSIIWPGSRARRSAGRW